MTVAPDKSRPDTRSVTADVREFDDSSRTCLIRVVTYGVIDSYGSNWMPGCFDQSLSERMPPAVYAHDWSRVIGSVKEYDSHSTGVDATIGFADFSSVPDARMAYSLLKDQHVKDTSFGFKRMEWDDEWNLGDFVPSLPGEEERIRRARLDEVSPVVRGAVPGSGVLAVRSDAPVTQTSAADLLTRLATGQIDLRTALNALDGLAPLPVTPAAVEPTAPTLDPADASLALALLRHDGYSVPLTAEPVDALRAVVDGYALSDEVLAAYLPAVQVPALRALILGETR